MGRGVSGVEDQFYLAHRFTVTFQEHIPNYSGSKSAFLCAAIIAFQLIF